MAQVRVTRDGADHRDEVAENVTATHPVRVCADPDDSPTLEMLLGRQLDAISYGHLETAYPALAEALQEVIECGYSPQQIRQFVMQRGMPLEWARWLQQAARFLRE